IPPPPPISTLFPYTTLFRSRPRPCQKPSREFAHHHRACASGLRRPRGTARARKPGRCAAATARSPLTTSTETAAPGGPQIRAKRSEEHTSELQSRGHLVCRL